MLEMLKARKEELQARGVKGFTLMEMLIVIAIIAVLVAIAIPVLGSQLENAQEATDAANLRSAYAVASVQAMQENKNVAAGPVTMSQGDKSSWASSVKDDKIGGKPLPTGIDNVWVVVTTSGDVSFVAEADVPSSAQKIDPVNGTDK